MKQHSKQQRLSSRCHAKGTPIQITHVQYHMKQSVNTPHYQCCWNIQDQERRESAPAIASLPLPSAAGRRTWPRTIFQPSWKPSWTPWRLVSTPRPEVITKPSTVTDTKSLPGVTTPDLMMWGRRAALPTKPETTFQAPPTRMLMNIIMCCPHLLNNLQAVPFRETKTCFLFLSWILRRTLCYYYYAMQFLLKFQEHLELPYEQWTQIILKLFKKQNFIFSYLGDFCLYGIVDLTHSHNMPLQWLGWPTSMHGTNASFSVDQCLLLSCRLRWLLKITYLTPKCHYHTSILPRSQLMAACTTQCLSCLYLSLFPTLPISVVLNQIPPTSQLLHISQLDDPPTLMNAPHIPNSATQPCRPVLLGGRIPPIPPKLRKITEGHYVDMAEFFPNTWNH